MAGFVDVKRWSKVKTNYVIVEIRHLQNFPRKVKLLPDSTLPGKTKSKKQQTIILTTTRNHNTNHPMCLILIHTFRTVFPFHLHHPVPATTPSTWAVTVGSCWPTHSLGGSKLGAADAPLPSAKVQNILKNAGIRINSSSVQQMYSWWTKYQNYK